MHLSTLDAHITALESGILDRFAFLDAIRDHERYPDDNLASFKMRLRAPTPENIREDLALWRAGILDTESFISGYQWHAHPVEIEVRRPDGSLKFLRRTHNIRTNTGGHDQGVNMSGVSGSVAAANYIGLSTDTTHTIVAGDTYLQNSTPAQAEITNSDLARASATVSWTTDPAGASGSSTTTNTGTYKLSHTWTATSSYTGVQKAGVFNGATVGTPGSDMWFAFTFTSVNLNSGDTLTVNYSLTF